MDIITPVLSRVLTQITIAAGKEAYRGVSAWKNLDTHMLKINRAFNKVRQELCDIGLLDEHFYLDKVDLEISRIPDYGEAGYVYDEDVAWHQKILGFRKGVIYLPSTIPHEAFVPGGTLVDIIRHEFAHAWRVIDPEFFDETWFTKAFSFPYSDKESSPRELWEGKKRRNPTFTSGLRACRNDRERINFVNRAFNQDFVSPYASTMAAEDFAETFMTYLRSRNSLSRYQHRLGVFKKLKATETAVSKKARELR